MKVDNKGFFFCYDKTMSDFLRREGISYITVAKDPKSEKLFSLYRSTSKLQVAIDKFKREG